MKYGEVIKLGRHTIMCGDCTRFEDVNRLMGDVKADMVFTDPPYGVNYSGRRKERVKIANDNINDEEFLQFLHASFDNAKQFTNPGAMVYVCMSMSKWTELSTAMKSLGYHWSNTVMWLKDSFVVSWGDYHNQYELVWYGWRTGAKRLHPVADRSQSNVWKIKRPKASKLHPTMKPIELCKRAIANSSNENDVVLDMFGGSGSTLIACEELGRTCYMMELDPHYCDVIVARWTEGKTKQEKI